MNKNRITYIDCLRVLACFFVIFNHTKGFSAFTDEYGIRKYFYMFFSIVDKSAVPLFFMISGYMLLGKEESIADVYRKRVSKISIVLILFSLIAYCQNIAPVAGFSLKRIIKGILSNSIEGCMAYWYLYSYLAFLAMIPFIRSIAKCMNKKYFEYLLVLHFIMCSFIPVLRIFVDSTVMFSLPIAAEYCIFFPLIGFGIGNIPTKTITKRNMLCVIFTCAVCIICGMIAMNMALIRGMSAMDYVTLFDYAIAITVFLIFKYLFDDAVPEKLGKFFSELGSCTFEIYLIDPILRRMLIDRMGFYNVGDFAGSILYCVFAIIFYGMIIYILKKVPILDKLF